MNPQHELICILGNTTENMHARTFLDNNFRHSLIISPGINPPHELICTIRGTILNISSPLSFARTVAQKATLLTPDV